MDTLRICILDGKKKVLGTSHGSGDGVALVHRLSYRNGDVISLSAEESGLYYLQLDETLGRRLVFLQTEAWYPVPAVTTEESCFSPTAFSGDRHLLTLEKADPSFIPERRNLALNPYDSHTARGIFPHAAANVETRNELVFAARNAIDGILENKGHGEYPYGSWGINRNPRASLTVDFGRMVVVDAIRLTLRADFPHDSWWTEATVSFNDGSSETLNLQKTAAPQYFPVRQRTVTSLKLHTLVKADDISPFPALTQIEAFGKDYPQ